jgi:methyl-accepting chemotaxis protein
LTNDLVETNNIIITSPGANSVVSDTIAVSAMLSSKISGVDPMLVEFYVDGGFMENALGSSAIRSWTFMWNTAALTDGSTHTLMVRAYLDNANITEDSITVVVSAKSVSDKIADLENKISQLQSDLNEMNASASQSLIDLESQIADLQDALDEMNATSSQDLSGLQDQVQALQDQLDALQTTTGTAKDSAASANMFAMIGMLVAIIVLVLVIISMMMSRSKK